MTTVYRRMGAVWCAAGAALIVWAVAGAIAHSSATSDYHRQQRQAAKLERFYRAVAGDEAGDGSGMLNKLARDLRATPIGQVVDFRGDSNRYGGISGELGFDPFDGDNCSECGPLDTKVILDVMQIKSGGLDQVLADSAPRRPRGGATGPGLALWLLWALSLPGLYLILWLSRRRSHSLRYREMSGEMQLIHKLDHALEGTFENPQERYELQHVRDRLMQEIETRVRYGDRAKQRLRLDGLKEEAANSLDAIEQGNRALPQ